MVVLDWLKPAVIFGSVFYAFIGVLILWVCFILFDKITPYRLWDELVEKKNVALVLMLFRCGSGGGPGDCSETRNTFGDASQEYQNCLAGQRSGGGYRSGGGSFGGFSSGGGHK